MRDSAGANREASVTPTASTTTCKATPCYLSDICDTTSNFTKNFSAKVTRQNNSTFKQPISHTAYRISQNPSRISAESNQVKTTGKTQFSGGLPSHTDIQSNHRPLHGFAEPHSNINETKFKARLAQQRSTKSKARKITSPANTQEPYPMGNEVNARRSSCIHTGRGLGHARACSSTEQRRSQARAARRDRR